MFGHSKKTGKALNAGQWLYKIEQESKSKRIKDLWGDAAAYKAHAHHELLKVIGEEAYRKVFSGVKGYYTLISGGRDNPAEAASPEDPSLIEEFNQPFEEPANEPNKSGVSGHDEPSTSKTTPSSVPAVSGGQSTSRDSELPLGIPLPGTPEKRPSKRPAEPSQADTPSKFGRASDPGDTPTSPQRQEEAALPLGEADIDMGDVAPLAAGNAAPSSSGPGATGGIAEQPLQFYKAKGLYQKGNQVIFNNTFRLRSFGNALHVINPAGNNGNGQPSITTPMVALPVEHLSFYVPYSVYRWMTHSDGLAITGVEVKVTPIGQMVSFATNSVASSSAAPAHTLYGMANVGINTVVPCDKVTITRNSTSPMTLSAVSAMANMSAWTQRLWGTSTTTDINNPYTAHNHEIILPNTYLRIHQLSNAPGTFPPTPADHPVSMTTGSWGYYPLNRYLTKFPIKPHTGLPVINFSYKVEPALPCTTREMIMGQTARRNDSVATGDNRKAVSLNVFRTRAGNGRYQFRSNERALLRSEPIANAHDIRTRTYGLWRSTDQGTDYTRWRETTIASHLIFTVSGEGHMSRTMPGVFFGIEAVQSNVPEVGIPDYVNASCDWYVETNLIMNYKVESIPMAYNPDQDRMHVIAGPKSIHRPLTTVTDTQVVFNQSLMGHQIPNIPAPTEAMDVQGDDPEANKENIPPVARVPNINTTPRPLTHPKTNIGILTNKNS